MALLLGIVTARLFGQARNERRDASMKPSNSDQEVETRNEYVGIQSSCEEAIDESVDSQIGRASSSCSHHSEGSEAMIERSVHHMTPDVDKSCVGARNDYLASAVSSGNPSLDGRKRRRSNRQVQRIKMWERTSLARRRFDQLFSDSTSTTNLSPLRIDHWTLERVNSSPNIYLVENFLSQTDLDYFHACIDSMPFERSFVDNNMHRLYDKTHRTSSFLSFDKRQNARIAAIEQRAATLMGCFSTGVVEALQLVRYRAGEFFGVHHDLGDYDVHSGTVALPPKQIYLKGCNRRLVTIFCYLNDVKSGGQTHFPALNLKVQPLAGRAIVWQNILITGEPDARTIHAGLPVEEGVKFALNIWLCEE